MGFLIIACVGAIVMLIMFGVFLLAILQEGAKDKGVIFGGLCFLLLISIAASASIYGIIDESYKMGVKDVYFNRIKVEVIEDKAKPAVDEPPVYRIRR